MGDGVVFEIEHFNSEFVGFEIGVILLVELIFIHTLLITQRRRPCLPYLYNAFPLSLQALRSILFNFLAVEICSLLVPSLLPPLASDIPDSSSSVPSQAGS